MYRMSINEPVWSVEEACLKKQIYSGSDRAANHLSVACDAQGRRVLMADRKIGNWKDNEIGLGRTG